MTKTMIMKSVFAIKAFKIIEVFEPNLLMPALFVYSFQ
jgi:hypothetical protein